MENNLFPDRLRRLRDSKGLSQQYVAEIAKATDSAYQAWEYGKAEPKARYIKALAQFFEVSTDYLLGLDDIPNRRLNDAN